MQSHPEDINFEGAKLYALTKLKHELPLSYTYHNYQHTALDVLPAAHRLAQESGLDSEATQLLEVAAAFHDLGYIHQRQDHETVSIALMASALPNFGFSPAQINLVARMIEATRMPQSPRTPLEYLLADADLDSLGRDNFLTVSHALWLEMNIHYQPRSWYEWLKSQLVFLQSHHYFSPAARALRDAGKAQNIDTIKFLLSKLQPDCTSEVTTP